MDADTKSILFNVIGGVIVSILTIIYLWCRHKFKSLHLQRVLGFSFSLPARITYSQFLPPPFINQATGAQHIFPKPPRKGGNPTPTGMFSLSHPVSECEVRGSSYLSSLLSSSSGRLPILLSDTDASALVDSNFLCLGWVGSNYKTADIVSSPRNIFLKKVIDKFVWISGGELPYKCSNEADYGIILRIASPEFPDKAWIVCAGLGEWGTSGAAWFLSNKWQDILKRKETVFYRINPFRFPDFLAIIRVVPEQDESSSLVELYVNKKGQAAKVK